MLSACLGNASETEKQEKVQQLRDVAKLAQLRPQAKKAFRNYYDVMYKHKSVFSDVEGSREGESVLKEIIDELPESIRRHLVEYTANNFKEDYHFLKDMGADLLLPLTMAIRRIRFPLGETIFFEKDEAREVYFMVNGTAEISRLMTSGPQVLHRISGGHIFGHVELCKWLGDTRVYPMADNLAGRGAKAVHKQRRRTVKCVSACDVGFVPYEDMAELMINFPNKVQREFFAHRVRTAGKNALARDEKEIAMLAAAHQESSEPGGHDETMMEAKVRVEGGQPRGMKSSAGGVLLQAADSEEEDDEPEQEPLSIDQRVKNFEAELASVQEMIQEKFSMLAAFYNVPATRKAVA